MASIEGLVPITRAYLASYYDKYPLDPPLSEDVVRLSSELRSFIAELQTVSPLTTDEALVVQEVDCQPPHKIDQNMWKNREHIEELLYMMNLSNLPAPLQQASTPEDAELASLFKQLKDKLESSLKVLMYFQSKNADFVFNTVMTYLPQDFRGTLIRQQRERSERNRQAEVDALVNSGGTIRDKYFLLWKQQMERRRQLASLGSATGVYKTLVKYLVGVPQSKSSLAAFCFPFLVATYILNNTKVLLDFIQKINDDEGPMEEQRQRYGPPLYSLTVMALCIRAALMLAWGRFEARKLEKNQVALLEQSINVYTSEFERFINFMGQVFANSPFFVSANEVTESRDDEDFKETNIAAGKTYEVLLNVDSVNSYIAWDFSVEQGKLTMDVGFSMEYSNGPGEKTSILPYRRCTSDQGNFCTVMAGNYKLIWDNTYSTFFKKALRFKVDCIPPVTEPVQE